MIDTNYLLKTEIFILGKKNFIMYKNGNKSSVKCKS